MKTRLSTSVFITLGLIVTLLSRLFTPYFFDVVVSVLAIIATFEISTAFTKSKKDNFQSIVGLFPSIVFVIIFLGFSFNLSWVYYVSALGGLMLFSLFGLTLIGLAQLKIEDKDASVVKNKFAWKTAYKKAFNTTLILIYPTMLFSSLLVLNRFSSISFVQNTALGTNLFEWFVVLLAILVPVGCDVFAMISGMLLKGPKLAPKISPKKTISGFFGGILGGTLFAFSTYLLFSINLSFNAAIFNLGGIWFVLLIGIFGSVICQIGDLIASLIKRRAFIKDYGKIFPGHGGVMDRYDGMIFTSTLILISLFLILIFV